MTETSSLIVEIHRGGFLESRHQVSAAIIHAHDGVVDSIGDIKQSIFPRSAIKMIQAIPYVQTLIEQGVPLNAKRVALASASHWADEEHLEIAREWLKELSLPEDVLRCGAHTPYSDETAKRLIEDHKEPSRLHNNCSGKHLAMIETCLRLREDPKTYYQQTHICQRRVIETVARFCELDDLPSQWGIDGCGIPAYRMPLMSLGKAMANFAKPDGKFALEDVRAIKEIRSAIQSHPTLIGSKDDESSKLTAESRGRAIVKIGAEGIMTAALPEAGIGIVLKVHDGASRASEAAIAHLLASYDAIDASFDPAQNPRPLHNWAGERVGELRLRRLF